MLIAEIISAVLTNVGGKPGPQQRFAGRIHLAFAEHLFHRPNRLNECSTDSTKVAALSLNGHPAGHVGEHIGEEAQIQAPLSNVKSLMAQFVKGQVLKRHLSHDVSLTPEDHHQGGPGYDKSIQATMR